jgi:hypothetical protein
MSVGMQANKAVMDQNLTQLALQMRNLMTQVANEWQSVNNGAGGTPVEVLTALGYDNSNTDAPGDQSDAAYASYLLNTMNTLAQIYFGQATQATEYDFDNALAVLWAGQY